MDIIFKTSEFKIKFRNSEQTNKNTEYISEYLDAYFNELFQPKMIVVYTTKEKVYAHIMDFEKEYITVYSGNSSDGKPCLRFRNGIKDVKKWNLSHDLELGTIETFKEYVKELSNKGDVSERMLFEYHGLKWSKQNDKHSEKGDFKDYQVKFFDNASILLEDENKIKELYIKHML